MYLPSYFCIMCLEAIESGHLPADILDDIPVKYVDGALICEVIIMKREIMIVIIDNSGYNHIYT
jgi:hypothetical protein